MGSDSNRDLSTLSFGLKKMILDECKVTGVRPQDIDDTESLISGPGALQLDSLDAVEIVGALERNLGVSLDSVGESRKVFASTQIMAAYVAEHADPQKLEDFLAQAKAQEP